MPLPARRTAALLVWGLAACAPSRPPAAVPALPEDDACAISTGGSARADTVTVALPGGIDPAHAPLAQTDAERVLFRALYQPLIRVDCAGRAWPGVAEAWTPEEGGRRWTFVLRSDARFWDGEPLTAYDVLAAWTVAAADTMPPLAPFDGPVTQAVQVMSDRVVSIRLARPYATVPLAFGDVGLAVTKRPAGIRWPIGTGRYWVNAAAREVTAAPAFGGGLPVLAFRGGAERAARDLLDAGVDLLVTDDPAVLAYAAGRSDLTTAPLPWERTYVVVTGPVAPAPLVPGGIATRDREALARDAVRIDARAAAGPFWWDAGAGCPMPAPASLGPPRGGRGAARTVYPRGDPVARDLANRLVALSGGGAVASGLSPDAFAAALREGAAAAYVLALPRRPLDSCLALQALIARAPWLEPRAVVPLVDVRRRVIARRGVGGLTADWDGTPRLP